MKKNKPKHYNLKCGTGFIGIKINPINFKVESDYLIISRKKQCKEFLSKKEITRNDIIDFLISLHIVLEVGLHTFYRNIFEKNIEKLTKNPYEGIKDFDNINLKEKTIFFIYFSEMDFKNKEKEAQKHYSVIEKIKTFSDLRNLLLHGHAISEQSISENEFYKSRLSGKLNGNTVKEQIKRFKEIIDGIEFYFDCIKNDLTPHKKEKLKKSYLDYSFLKD